MHKRHTASLGASPRKYKQNPPAHGGREATLEAGHPQAWHPGLLLTLLQLPPEQAGSRDTSPDGRVGGGQRLRDPPQQKVEQGLWEPQ